MKTQISRDSFRGAKRYSGVYQQQGRMLTDADWNELSELVKRRIDEVIRDAIGSGAPRDRGLEVLANFRLNPGYLYVDGIAAQLPGTAPIDYNAQPDFSEAQALPLSEGPTAYTLYADVWERPVIALEDSALLDPGLHGADTCTRTRTMLQIKWCDAVIDPADSAMNPAKGDAPLTIALWRASSGTDPCDPCAAEVALDNRIGNYLFRVEVHDVQLAADGSAQLTLKWSSENGAEQHQAAQLPPGFDQGDWVYEFFNLACEENLGVHLASGFSPSRGQLLTSFPAVAPEGHPWVRRWDGYAVLNRSSAGVWSFGSGTDKGVTMSIGLGEQAHGHVAVAAEAVLNLNAMVLTLGLDGHQFVAGDFWLATVREAADAPDDILLNAAAPQGIEHHYLVLAELDSAGVVSAYDSDADRRQMAFPPLTDLWAADVGYDNQSCNRSNAENVQQALDWLCQQRDLRWHNKHLHGWGIVCGLQVECGPDTLPVNGADEGERRQAVVRKGYAIDCEGNDVVLEGADILELMALIEQHDAAQPNAAILNEGDGSASLTIALGDDGQPEFAVEKYDPKAEGWASMLDGTLLMDFYEHCIKDLVDAVKDELTADEDENNALVGPTLRRWITLFNLVIQLFNYDNGRYVFLSPKEHEILKAFYLRLQELLRSKTFCAMFEGDEFPDYPFEDTGLSTIFGKGWHTRLRVSPDGRTLFTCGANNDTIHVFNVEKEEMIAEVRMPAGEGARVVDLALRPDSKELFAIAYLASGDTVIGVAELDENGTMAWRPVRVLCGLQLTCLVFSPDGKHLWSIAKGAGLFAFDPDTVLEGITRPEPKYAFNAVGQLSIDTQGMRAWATANSGTALSNIYQQAVGMDLTASGSHLSPQRSFTLTNPETGNAVSGSDDILFVPAPYANQPDRLCVVTGHFDANDQSKHVLVYPLYENDADDEMVRSFDVEDAIVRLAWHTNGQRLVVSLEDGYRLQLVDLDKNETSTFRHPVQISPVSLVSHDETDRLYVLNYVSNTISVIPGAELETSQEFLQELDDYRGAVLAAYWELVGSLLQYLKDCFCHHLLIRCPECDDGDKLYLAGIEIRDHKIYKICNFAKRKYVKSFPTVGYWLSLVPIMPLFKRVVQEFCCLVFPDLFDKLYFKYALANRPSYTHMQSANRVQSADLRKGIEMFQGANFKSLMVAEKKNFNVLSLLTRDNLLNRIEAATLVQPGMNRNQVLDANVDEAQQRLQQQGVQVESVQNYDRMQDAGKLAQYREVPMNLAPGTKVNLYQRDGKVMFYTLAQQGGAVTGVSPEVQAEITELERRKLALRDLSEVNAELARSEARRAEVANLTASRDELGQLEQQKMQIQQELSTLKADLAGLQSQRAGLADVQALASQIAAARSQLEVIRQTREAEQAAVVALEARRVELSSSLTAMRGDLDTLVSRQRELMIEFNKAQPVLVLDGVDGATANRLAEAGVRTVDELSKADATVLNRVAIDTATASKLIDLARNKLILR